MLCGWKGNCRSGVVLALHHILSCLVYPWYRLNGQCEVDEHSTYKPFTFTRCPVRDDLKAVCMRLVCWCTFQCRENGQCDAVMVEQQ